MHQGKLSPGSHLSHSGEEHGVFQVYVLVKVCLKILESGKKRPICVARLWGRLIPVSQLPQFRQCRTGILVLLQHHGDRAFERSRRRFTPAHRFNSGKKNLLLFLHVAAECVLHFTKNPENLNQR